MEMCVSPVDRQRTKAPSKSVLIVSGDLWHRVNGARQMQGSSVDSWDILQKVQSSLFGGGGGGENDSSFHVYHFSLFNSNIQSQDLKQC